MNTKTDLIIGRRNSNVELSIKELIKIIKSIFQLSVINNRLIRMFQVGKLHHLKVLDLSNNNIVTIEGLKVHLQSKGNQQKN